MNPIPARPTAALVLADGSVFWGHGIGAIGQRVGEICFIYFDFGIDWIHHGSRTRVHLAVDHDAILRLVDAEDPPLRLFLGTSPLPIAEQRYAERLETWNAWRDVSEAAQGDTRSS